MISGKDSGPISVRAGFKPGDNVGAYRLVRKIGAGGMGTVFEATHEELGRRCAIKILKDEFSSNPKIVRRFFNEARAVAKIRHENIIDVYDFGQTATTATTSSWSCSRASRSSTSSRRARCRSSGPASSPDRSRARWRPRTPPASCIATSSRPTSSSSVARRPRDFVKVLDFGIAKLLHESEADDTETGMVIGHPRYMSPEQCRGGKQVDHRSDIYALGMLLYHMIAGRLAFDADNPGDMMVQHLTITPPALSTNVPDLPPEVDALVARALAKDPLERIQRMDDFADALVPFGAPARPPDVPAHEPAIPASFDYDVDDTPALGPVTPVVDGAAGAAGDQRRAPTPGPSSVLAAGDRRHAARGGSGRRQLALVTSRPKAGARRRRAADQRGAAAAHGARDDQGLDRDDAARRARCSSAPTRPVRRDAARSSRSSVATSPCGSTSSRTASSRSRRTSFPRSTSSST